MANNEKKALEGGAKGCDVEPVKTGPDEELELLIVRLGPSPKLKLELKGLDQSRTLNSHITTTHHHPPQTFLPVPG